MTKAALLPRLIGLLVAFGLGIYYIGFVILGYHAGSNGYDIRVQVPSAAGLFADGNVTYRGVPVGTITRMDLAPDDVELQLHITSSEKIPASSSAHVKMLSALGEQYVNLVPASPGGPYLHQGSVIPQSRTTVPIAVGQVLASAQKTLGSVDPQDLHTVETFLATAFSNVTPQLKQLVQTGQDLTQALIRAQAGTQALILDGQTVLRAGNDTSEQLQTYVAALDTLSRQFADSDQDVAHLISGGSGSLAQIEKLLQTESGPFKDLLAGAGAAGSVISASPFAVNELFAIVPEVSDQLGAAAQGGTLSGALRLNSGQPVCTYAGVGPLPLPGVAGADGSPGACTGSGGPMVRGPQHVPGGGR